MLWFEVKGGSEAGRVLMNSVQRPWSLCENLGAVESICTCPSVMTHANMLQEDRLKVGITRTLTLALALTLTLTLTLTRTLALTLTLTLTASRWASPTASCASHVASRTPTTSSPL